MFHSLDISAQCDKSDSTNRQAKATLLATQTPYPPPPEVYDRSN